MFKNFRNLDLNLCIEGEDWISAGRLLHKIVARGKNEHNDDDLVTEEQVDDASKLTMT